MSDWTDEQIELLKKLWGEKLSASQIMQQLPFSRSAILGKVHRLKLDARRVVNAVSPVRAESRFNPPANRAAALKKRPPPGPRAHNFDIPTRLELAGSEPGLPDHLDEPAVGAGIQLIELTNSTCRWPFGHPNTDRFFFCGAAGANLQEKQPYCPFHTRKARAAPTRTQKEFDDGVLYAAGLKRSTSKGAHHG